MTKIKFENNLKELRTAKGYRLKVSTHGIIKELQKLTNNNADGVIRESCQLLYKKILIKKKKHLNN